MSQVVLVTGSTDGLGRALAHELAARGATTLLHGRDATKGEATLREIRDATGNERLAFYLADSSLAQVCVLAKKVLGEHERLDELRDRGVTANCLHPGTYMPTKMVRGAGVSPVDSLESGAEATLRLVADPELEGVTGKYFDRTREARAHPQAYDTDARRRLRELSAELVGLRE